MPDGDGESHTDRVGAVRWSGRVARRDRGRRQQPGKRHGSGGTSSLSFTVHSRAVSTINAGTYTASYGGASKSLNLSVRPIYVQTLVLTPSSVVGGNPVSGVATTECAAPSGGMTVALSSTNPTIAAPTTSSIVVAAGATKATFTVRTTRPAATTTVTIKAAAHAVTKNAVVTVSR